MEEYITLEEFISYIREHIIEEDDTEVTVSIEEVTKMNGKVYTGLILKNKKTEGAPICYLEDFYQMYRRGMPLEECLDRLRDFYSCAEKIAEGIRTHNVNDFSGLKDQIVYRLVNYEKNKKMLEKCPHIQLHDLAIIFYCIVTKLDIGFSTMLITKEEERLWKTDIHELLLLARENTRRIFPEVVILMNEFLKESMDLILAEEMEQEEIYILSNVHLTNGATVILYEGVLKDVAKELGYNYYLLPSSIHEMLIVPDDGNVSLENLASLVPEVNHSIVSEEDYLSDSVYYYDREKNKLICCCT